MSPPKKNIEIWLPNLQNFLSYDPKFFFPKIYLEKILQNVPPNLATPMFTS
jgi:hypothetical protein